MIKYIFSLVLVLPGLAMSALSEDDAQNTYCYVKDTAPDLVSGNPPFDCKGKGKLFEALMDHELKMISSMINDGSLKAMTSEDFFKCKAMIITPNNRVKVARQFFELKDSPVLSPNASMAFSITTVCKGLVGSR